MLNLQTKLMKFLKTKYFTPIAFLIFFMPFLRMCKERRETVENIDQNTKGLFQKIEYQNDDSGYIRIYKETNLNAYQLGLGTLKSIFNNEFQLKVFLKDKDFFSIISYTFIIIFSILMIVFSWLRKFLKVRNLAVANIILLIISTILFVKSGIIDEFADVKYGLYVFLIYSIFIIYISKKENLELKKT